MTTGIKLGEGRIGPSAWRNNTLREIKQAQDVVKSSDKSLLFGRSNDPLPHLREVLAELSNDEAHQYFRQTRAVVCLLRESLIDTNEEIKSLTRGKEALEKALEHIRKDIRLNNECQDIRTARPAREKDHDGADDLLHAERMQLLGLKRMLEQQLQLVQQQLQVLDRSRQRLAAVVQERSRVLDLVCAALPSGAIAQSAMFYTSRTPRYTSRRMTLSASVDCTKDARASAMAGGYCGNETGNMDQFQIDPLGPYTPEADSALQEAKDARNRSVSLRKELKDLIGRVDRTQKTCHSSVNHSLTGKIAETVGLKQQLDVASGENRHSINRAQRWFDHTERAWHFSKGPVSTGDMTSHEKLNRPIIAVFQRHPGTNLPEAQEIIRGGDGLLSSLHTTGRNIGQLRLTQLRLHSDIRDKQSAIDVDGGVVRLRRRKANHRWVVGEAF